MVPVMLAVGLVLGVVLLTGARGVARMNAAFWATIGGGGPNEAAFVRLNRLAGLILIAGVCVAGVLMLAGS